MRATTYIDGQQHAELGMIEAFTSGMGQASMRHERMEFLPWARKYLPHYFPLPPSKFHEELGGELERMTTERGTQLLDIAPRDSAKSTLISTAYPLYALCHGFEAYIIIGSDSTDQASKHVQGIRRELEDNDRIRVDYPEVFGPGPVWTKTGITCRTGQRVEAVGAGKRMRGRREGESRPTLVIIDDPEDQDSLWSESMRSRRYSWLVNAVMKAGAKGITNYVLVGTMIHDDCTVARILKTPGWRGRKVWRSIIKFPTSMDLWDQWEAAYHADKTGEEADAYYADHKDAMHEGADVLWPARLSLLDLMKERAQDRASFARERQNEPENPEGSRFDADWFSSDDLWFDEPPPGLCFAVVDPATGKNKKAGDYSAIVWAWWKEGDPHLYIDAILRKTSVSSTNDAFVDAHIRHEFTWSAYEAIAFQEVGRQDLNTRMASRGFNIPIIPATQSVNKFLRIDRLGPLLQQDRFRFRRGSEGALLLFQQLKRYSFPATDKLDGPDALEMVVRLIGHYAKMRSNPQGFKLSQFTLKG